MSEPVFNHEKKCPICSKVFYVPWPDIWTYRRKIGGLLKYFCTYSCVRKFDKEKGGVKPVGIVFNEKNQKAIDIAMAGGDPIAYLRETGSKDGAKLWYYIRRQLKEKEPEQYEKLPSGAKDCRARNTGSFKPQKAEVPEAPAVQFSGVETPEDTFKAGMDLAKIRPEPLVYDGLTVREVEGNFGRYRRSDIGPATYIDFEPAEACDTISFTVEHWRKFRDEFDKSAAVLGVAL